MAPAPETSGDAAIVEEGVDDTGLVIADVDQPENGAHEIGAVTNDNICDDVEKDENANRKKASPANPDTSISTQCRSAVQVTN